MQISAVFKNRDLLLYGFSLALLLFLLKWLESRFMIIDHHFEIYAGSIALLFMGLGIWLALELMQPKTHIIVMEKERTLIVEKEVLVEKKIFIEKEVVIEKEIGVEIGKFTRNEVLCKNLNLSKRELEVLELMSSGLSYQEMAGRLFVSLNTLKTHSSKIFEKLEVKRRVQAVEKAKDLKIIP